MKPELQGDAKRLACLLKAQLQEPRRYETYYTVPLGRYKEFEASFNEKGEFRHVELNEFKIPGYDGYHEEATLDKAACKELLKMLNALDSLGLLNESP